MYKVLVVDDDASLRLSVATALGDAMFKVDQAENGEDALNKFFASKYDLVIMDVNMPFVSGIEALRQMKIHDPSAIVIILTAYSNVPDAVEAVKLGAYNYLEKPIRNDDLISIIERAVRAQNMVKNLTMSAPIFKLGDDKEFIGHSSGMRKVFSIIEKLTAVSTSVLIRGESGTGKELVAQAIHFNSPRKDERFVTINCSAIPENLIESEFFGHEKGAFTGADNRKIGKFQYADGGTLFLDEIGDISPTMQVKLLRVLQERKFTPLGSNREIEVNVRIIAATNRNLEDMVSKNEFREDLFYRLNVLPVFLPPLRDRKDDISHLVNYFIGKFNKIHRKKINAVSPEALQILMSHDWPGNIRELENVVEHAFVIEHTPEIQASSLPEKLTGVSRKSLNQVTQKLDKTEPQEETKISQDIASGKTLALDISSMDFQASKDEFEKTFIINALKSNRGKINQTAIKANIPKKTLLRKLEKYGITAKDYSN